MQSNEWIALGIGLTAIMGSLVGQALFWGVFKGTVQAQILGINKTIDALQGEETMAKRELWRHVDDHGQRIFGIETECKLNHSHRSYEEDIERESHSS